MAAIPVTFQPIGIAETQKGFSVVTSFEETVMSFDNVLQREGGGSRQQTEAALVYAAAALIFLHANKFNHLDYQIKNTASDGISSRVIDVTTVKRRGDVNVGNVEFFLHDVAVYVNSVVRNHALNSVDKDMMRDTFIDYYLACVTDIFPSELQGHVKHRIESIVDSAYGSV